MDRSCETCKFSCENNNGLSSCPISEGELCNYSNNLHKWQPIEEKKEMNFVEAIIFMKETGKECVNSFIPSARYKIVIGILMSKGYCDDDFKVCTVGKKEQEATWTVYEPEKPKTKWYRHKYLVHICFDMAEYKGYYRDEYIITKEPKENITFLNNLWLSTQEIETSETGIKKIYELFKEVK